jgi:bifunctional non-homologous end joining protein LigD
VVTVAGVELSHPDRVLYPEQGITKRDLARYYAEVARWMLPHVIGRPLALVRCPEGRQRVCFYQKHWRGPPPPGVNTVPLREAGGAVRDYTWVDSVQGLIALVQHGVLEFHVWGARLDRLERPDRMVFDLDPSPEVPWRLVREAARDLRALLAEQSLGSWVKTTGGKGLHLVVPLDRHQDWRTVAGFARAMAERLVARRPDRYLARARKAERKGKIFVDWLRNTRGATAIAPWSTRARAGAPVSAPVAWEDLGRVRSGGQFTLGNVPRLLARRRDDPWAALLDARQRLPAPRSSYITSREQGLGNRE